MQGAPPQSTTSADDPVSTTSADHPASTASTANRTSATSAANPASTASAANPESTALPDDSAAIVSVYDPASDTSEPSPSNDLQHSNTVCVIAPAESSRDPIWFIYVIAEGIAKGNLCDDHMHHIFEGEEYLECKYLEYENETKSIMKYRLMKQTVYIRKESIIYPVVDYQINNNNLYTISKVEYTDILNYVDNSGYAAYL